MKNKIVKKQFDAVKLMREIRDQMSLRIQNLSPDEEIEIINELSTSTKDLHMKATPKKWQRLHRNP
ncbi:MAG: hypothetical protein NTW14_01290 [bacterium]|nr:hypothetical protein [bacterium]